MKTKITIQLPKGNFLIAAETLTVWGLGLAIHRTPGKPNRWTISDPRTGFALGHGATREKARHELETRIEKTGNQKVFDLLAKQPAVTASEIEWSEPAKAETTVDVSEIAAAIAERAGVPVRLVERVLATKGKNAGRLLARCPSEDEASALWTAIQPNPWKVSVGRVLFLRGEARALFERVSALKWPVWLDSDASALVELGVW